MAMDPKWLICTKCGTRSRLSEVKLFHYLGDETRCCHRCFLEGEEKREAMGERKFSNYWIYPGQRRPVVVWAETMAGAEKKVHKSPEYDGFGDRVYRVEEFDRLCREGKAP